MGSEREGSGQEAGRGDGQGDTLRHRGDSELWPEHGQRSAVTGCAIFRGHWQQAARRQLETTAAGDTAARLYSRA